MNKLLLTTLFACASVAAFAQKGKKVTGQPEAETATKATPIQILYTDPNAKEDKLDNSWTFTNAKLLLHGTDTLSCDVMICRADVWLFKSNVRIASPDGLVVRANEMAISAVPKK